jgi:hypothetical protein
VIAAAAPAQVERRHGVRRSEVFELRLEGCAIAAPPGDEEQLWVAQASPFVVQPKALDFGVGHGRQSSHVSARPARVA